MSQDLINPLQALIAQAAKVEPRGEVSRSRARQAGAGDAVVVLADVSASMGELAGARRKIEILRDALRRTLNPDVRLIAFSALPLEVSSAASLPDPSGSTALHLAIDAAATYKPRQTIIISDGRPDCEQSALDAADQLTGRIDVIYCGPESDFEAIAFLQRLARSTGGSYHGTAAVNLLEPVRRLLLLTE